MVNSVKRFLGPVIGIIAAVVLVVLQVLVGKGVITADLNQSIQNLGADVFLVLAGFAPGLAQAIKASEAQAEIDIEDAASKASQLIDLAERVEEIDPVLYRALLDQARAQFPAFEKVAGEIGGVLDLVNQTAGK